MPFYNNFRPGRMLLHTAAEKFAARGTSRPAACHNNYKRNPAAGGAVSAAGALERREAARSAWFLNVNLFVSLEKGNRRGRLGPRREKDPTSSTSVSSISHPGPRGPGFFLFLYLLSRDLSPKKNVECRMMNFECRIKNSFSQ